MESSSQVACQISAIGICINTGHRGEKFASKPSFTHPNRARPEQPPTFLLRLDTSPSIRFPTHLAVLRRPDRLAPPRRCIRSIDRPSTSHLCSRLGAEI